MKRVIAVIVLSAFPASAQTHTALLSWTDTQNPGNGATTYNVYRAPGLCSGTPTFAKLASGVTGSTYADATVTVGTFCYQVTATVNALEGPPSPEASATVGPYAPTQLSITIK